MDRIEFLIGQDLRGLPPVRERIRFYTSVKESGDRKIAGVLIIKRTSVVDNKLNQDGLPYEPELWSIGRHVLRGGRLPSYASAVSSIGCKYEFVLFDPQSNKIESRAC